MEIGWVNTPQDWRDVFIMAFMVAGTLLFLVATLFTVIIGLLTVGTVTKIRGLLRTNLEPTLESVRETSESVRASAAFISDYAVRPVMRAYGAYAGARRFITTFGRLARHKRGR